MIPHSPLLNPLLMLTLDQAVNINAWQVDRVSVEFTGFNNFFDFQHTNFTARCGGRIKVARGFAEYGVTRCVSFPRFDDGEVGDDAAL